MYILSYYQYYTYIYTHLPTYLPTPKPPSEYRENENPNGNGAKCTLLVGEQGHSDILAGEKPTIT